MTVSLNHLSDLVRKRVAVAAYYFVPGVVFASWASRIPDVKQMLHLSNGQLGTVLFAIPIGQLLMMAFSGILVSRFGSKKMILLAEVIYAIVLFCMGSSNTVFQLILSLVAFGMMANLMNIATNTQACLVEKMYGYGKGRGGRCSEVLFQDHRPDSVSLRIDGICRHVL